MSGRLKRALRLGSASVTGTVLALGAWFGAPALVAAIEPATGGELVMAVTDGPVTFDPAKVTDGGSHRVAVQVFGGLMTQSPAMTLEPDLAQSWAMAPDAKEFTFKLRSNARFHDGRAVTAADVKYAIERAADPKTKSPIAADYLGDIEGLIARTAGDAPSVTGVVVDDPQTVRLKLARPNTLLPERLTYPVAFVVDKAELAGKPTAIPANGTGPFKRSPLSGLGGVLLLRNDTYHRGPAKISRVIMVEGDFFADALYQTGNVDIAEFRGQAAPDAMVTPYLDTSYIAFDTAAKPFDDVRVRRAFAYAVNWPKVRAAITQFGQRPARGIVPDGTPGFLAPYTPFTLDIQKAKALLAEAQLGPDPLQVRTALSLPRPLSFIVDDWAKQLGVKFDAPRPAEGNAKPPAIQVLYSGWAADYPDAEDFLYYLFSSKSTQNRIHYANPQFDALVEQAQAEADPGKRVDLYHQAEQLLLDDAVVLPIYHSNIATQVKPWVMGYKRTPLGTDDLRSVTKDYNFAPFLSDPSDDGATAGPDVTLHWVNPPGTAQVNLQVGPAFSSGWRGVNTIKPVTNSYTILGPEFGKGRYDLLPGAPYIWRVRVTGTSGATTPGSANWGPWTPWQTFTTPRPKSDGVKLLSPANGGAVARLPQQLQWSDSTPGQFMYEVQVSTDPKFGKDAPVWDNVVHGGITNPLDSWITPALTSNTTYHWRVRPYAPLPALQADWSPAWSFTTEARNVVKLPTGRIAFAQSQGTRTLLQVYEADGAIHAFGGKPTEGTGAAWSPDGSRLAYVQGQNLIVANADGSGPVTVAQSLAQSRPSWSPDGQRLAFTYQKVRTEPVSVATVAADASSPPRVLASGQSPLWSPDGGVIAYVTPPAKGSTEWSLSLIAPDGGSPTKLASKSDVLVFAITNWMPDGSALAYTYVTITDQDELDAAALVVNRDGATTRKLGEGNTAGATFSPDGARVIFGKVLGDGLAVMLQDVAGQTEPMQIASAFDVAAAWSPDSTKLALILGQVNRTSNIYLASLDGGALLEMTDGSDRKSNISWARSANGTVASLSPRSYLGSTINGLDPSLLDTSPAGAASTPALAADQSGASLFNRYTWMPGFLTVDGD